MRQEYFLYVTIVCLAISMITGIILTIKGRPYSAVLNTVHKLTSLAAGVFGGFIIRTTVADEPAIGFNWTIVIISALIFVVALFSGAMLTNKGDIKNGIVWTHRIVSWLAAGALAYIVFLVL